MLGDLTLLLKQIARFMSDGLVDLMKADKKIPRADIPAANNRVLHHQPELCAMILLDIKTELHQIMLNVINTCNDLGHIASIYEVLPSAGEIKQPWLDMEDFLEERGNDIFFGGRRASCDVREAQERYWEIMGFGPDFSIPLDQNALNPEAASIHVRAPMTEKLQFNALRQMELQSWTAKSLNQLLSQFVTLAVTEELQEKRTAQSTSASREGGKKHDPAHISHSPCQTRDHGREAYGPFACSRG